MRPGAIAVLILLSAWSSAAQQRPWRDSSGTDDTSASGHPDSNEELLNETIVSTLSASNQHTTLLQLLQRAKCIPLLAQIGSATLFAPTDQAWIDWEETHRPDRTGPLHSGWLGAPGLSEWLLPEPDVIEQRIAAGDDQDEIRTAMDNQNWALRQHLLYHMLNYTIPTSHFVATNSSKNSTLETTLLFPMSEQPVLPPVPDPGSPWLPRGGDGMLGGHGQRLRFALSGSVEGGQRGRVGLEWNGEAGVGVWDGEGWPKPKKGNDSEVSLIKRKVEGARWLSNGVVVGVEGVLEMPPTIEYIIRNTPSLSYLSRLLNPFDSLPQPLPDSLSTTPHLTIFAPSNAAFDGAFDAVERRYLESGNGEEGVGRILGNSVILGVGKGEVGWSDAWSKGTVDVEAASGLALNVTTFGGHLIVNGTEAETVDIFASNGVIHVVPSLLVQETFTLLNSAEKVLLSQNATRFVSLLRSANLSHTYVGEIVEGQKEEPWTILAPTDEVLDMMDDWGSHRTPPIPQIWSESSRAPFEARNALTTSLLPDVLERTPFQNVSPLAALLQYHILPGRWLPSALEHGTLVETELRTSALKGNRQRLRLDVSERLDPEHWDNVEGGEIRFGGVAVLGKPVKSGKSIIYLVSGLLSLPDDVLQTAVSDLQLSTFIAAIYAADLDRAVKKTPAVSYFIPRNRAFASFGLAMKYLFLPEGKDELRRVVRYHLVDDIVYSSDVETGKQVYRTLEGGDIVIERPKGKNSSISLHSPTKWEGRDSGEALPSNGDLRPSKVTHCDALTNTGVIHTLDSVVLPADVSITIAKLIRGSKQSTMMDLIIRGGLAWVLEGREPTSSEIQRAVLSGAVRSWDEDGDTPSEPDINSLAMPSYTLLCPTDKAFSRLNLTQYINDREALLNLLKLHIIPTQPTTPHTAHSKHAAAPPKDGQPLSLEDDLVYSTLLSSSSPYGDLAFRATGDNSYIVGIRNARGDLANKNEAARIGASGRASVRWRKQRSPQSASSTRDQRKGEEGESTEDVDEDGTVELWRGGMTLGGGVLMLDSVLVPYAPSWFTRWGWLVLTLSGLGVVLLLAAIGAGWWWMTRGRKEGYEPLEGEEEE